MDYKCNSCGHIFNANYTTRCPACKGHYVRRYFSEQRNGSAADRSSPAECLDPTLTYSSSSQSVSSPQIADEVDTFDGGGGDSGGAGASGDF